MVSDAPTPHSPPIAMPNMARSTSRTVRLGAKPDANSINEYNRTLTIKVGRRPQRSAARPNKYAPTGRIANVSKMANVTSVIWVLNSCAMSLSTNTTGKSRRHRESIPRSRPRQRAFAHSSNPTTPRCALLSFLRGSPAPRHSVCSLPISLAQLQQGSQGSRHKRQGPKGHS